ncbi:general stress protein [Nodosilinea sp. E11]|uniref:general stress protein n=1 Tax=Nodosilinea sp. E11 TaxID=3037479 RepID=UPI002934FE74|nr:general stress protein [Nodosilinea sp. E11]WOD40204.1 general stress protein [Nodosilinea sp. E11]
MASQHIHRRAVGVFRDRPTTASALQALSDSGFRMSHVSVIARDAERQNAIAGVSVNNEAGNHADTGGAVGAVTGGVLGGVTGLLVGLGTLVIPGIGPALLAGEAATALAALAGGAAGAAAGGLVGALVGMGIPEHRAKHYRDRVHQGDYLIMLKDTEPEIARAERTLRTAGIEDWGVYPVADDATAARAGSPNATFNGDPNHDLSVAPGRDNPYNRVDHPMDQGYPQGDRR